jgi:hypothetical protein
LTVSPTKVWTRIEATVRSTKLHAVEFAAKMPNPFLKLSIVDENAARSLPVGDGWHAFLDRCHEIGANAALGELSPYGRAKFRKRMASAQAWWWDPGAVWKGVKAAMANTHPASAAGGLH